MGEIKIFKDLIPCPFCGCGKTILEKKEMNLYERGMLPDTEGFWYTVFCDECVASVSDYPTEEEAIEAWNMRAQKVSKDEFIEKYCKTCRSQRCEGLDSKWFEGCKFKANLQCSYNC